MLRSHLFLVRPWRVEVVLIIKRANNVVERSRCEVDKTDPELTLAVGSRRR